MTSLLDIAGFEWLPAASSQQNGPGHRTNGGTEQAFALDVSDVISLGQNVAGDVGRRVSAAAGGVINAARQLKRPASNKRQHPSSILPPPLSESLPWLQEYTAVKGYKQVLDKDSLLQESGMFPADHLFKAMMLKGMMHDSIVLLKHVSTPSRPASSTDLLATCGGDISISITGAADSNNNSAAASPVPSRPASPVPVPAAPAALAAAANSLNPSQQCEAVAVYQLGTEVCGHAGIVHGGLTAAMIDESIGYLLYLARSTKVLSFEAVVTASLEVQYKKPLLPTAPVVVTAWVSEQQGRKIWVEAVVSDIPYNRPTTDQGAATAAATPTTPTKATAARAAAATTTTQTTDGSSQAAGGGAEVGSTSGGAAAGQQPAAATVYASAKALFIIPRPGGASAAALQQAAGSQKLFHAA